MKDFFYNLRAYAKENWIPILEVETEAFLSELLLEIKPKSILEIGTCIGYSSMVFSTLLKDNVKIDTIERNPKMVKTAKENHAKLGITNINIIESDAVKALPDIDKKYDFIFIDANKTKYPFYYEQAIRLINDGGYIVGDNIGFDGLVLSEEYPIHKHRTAVRALRKFVELVKEDPRLSTDVYEIGDGFTVSKVKFN